MTSIKIHDIATDTVTEREMTAQELAQHEADKVKTAERLANQAATAAARQVILDRLGITADEAALLLGAN